MEVLHLLSKVHWHAKVGDPEPFAWVTVVGYLLAAIGCIGCAVKAELIFGKPKVRLHRAIWIFLGVILFFLAVNKQLDLQILFTQTVKILATHYRIYEFGRQSKKYFILGLGLLSAGGLSWILWQVRHEWRRYVVILLGAVFIVRFVIVRAATFYGVGLPKFSVFTGGIKLNWLMEFLGALTVAIAAFFNLATAKNAGRKQVK